MSRFELAEAAFAIPAESRQEVARYLSRAYDAAADHPEGPMASLWLTLTVLVVVAGRATSPEMVTHEGSLVVRALSAMPKDRRPHVALAMLDVSDPHLASLLDVLARLLGSWSWE
jgi:hypothetical protein